MNFEWDAVKNKINIEKHGIDFNDAKLICSGLTLTVEDDRYDYPERRYITFGKMFETVIAVVHAESMKKLESFQQERRLKMSKKNTLNKSRTDFERLAKMKDSDIDYSDIPEITPEQFAKAVVRKGLKPLPK